MEGVSTREKLAILAKLEIGDANWTGREFERSILIFLTMFLAEDLILKGIFFDFFHTALCFGGQN